MPGMPKHAAVIEDVDIVRPGYTLPSTITLPARDGAVPCVVFFAGSGPTDRDWTSPLLPGHERQRRAARARPAGARCRIDPLRQGRLRRQHAEERCAGRSEDARRAVAGPLRRRSRGGVRRARGSGWLRQDLPARPQRRIDPRVVGGRREAGGSTLRRLHQPVRAVALDPRHGDRADPGDPHQGWQRRRGRGQGARGLSRGDAGARRTGARSVGASRGRGPVASDALAGATEGRARTDLRGPARGAARLSRSRPRGLGRQRRPGARVRCGQDLRGPGERREGQDAGDDRRRQPRLQVGDAGAVHDQPEPRSPPATPTRTTHWPTASSTRSWTSSWPRRGSTASRGRDRSRAAVRSGAPSPAAGPSRARPRACRGSGSAASAGPRSPGRALRRSRL